ncbi:Histone H3 [Giardia duodenalis]|uniref:Histone H3 n=1 Tax=Giardia intestinalis TaxID=5741 RepID=V6T884_GIAIN|nr:Histone H3 [Giardia intestinalis]
MLHKAVPSPLETQTLAFPETEQTAFHWMYMGGVRATQGDAD